MNKKLVDNNCEILKIENSNKFRDIAANYRENLFAALSIDGSYYWCNFYGKWFEMDDKLIVSLNESPYNSFNEIFIKHLQITYQIVEGMVIEFEDSFFRNRNYDNIYQVKKKLGEGSYGEVFKVNLVRDLKDTALKKLKFKKENEAELLKELEIFLLISKIDHKNIKHYYDFWIETQIDAKYSTLNIEMELCDQSLDGFLQTVENMKLEEINILRPLKYYISSAIFLEILEGVNYLHKQNPQIIHRDLCPDNILLKVVEKNKILFKIADFGLVTPHKYAEQLHEPDRGRLKYFAPEVENGPKYDKSRYF